MWRLVTLLGSFMIGKFANNPGPSAIQLMEQTWNTVRGYFSSALTRSMSSMVLVGGVLVSLHEITQQYDFSGAVVFNATLISFLVVALIGGIGVAIAAKKMRSPIYQNLARDMQVSTYAHQPTSIIETLITAIANEINKASRPATYPQPSNYPQSAPSEQTASEGRSQSYQNTPQPPLYH